MGGADTETTVPLPHMTTEEDKPNSSTVEPLMPAPGTPTQRPEADKKLFHVRSLLRLLEAQMVGPRTHRMEMSLKRIRGRFKSGLTWVFRRARRRIR